MNRRSLTLLIALLTTLPASAASQDAYFSDGAPNIPEVVSELRFGVPEDEAAALYPELAEASWYATSDTTTLALFFYERALHAISLGLPEEGAIDMLTSLWGEPTVLRYDVGEAAAFSAHVWFNEAANIRAEVVTSPSDTAPWVVDLRAYTPLDTIIEGDALTLELLGMDRAELEATYGASFTDSEYGASLRLPPIETALASVLINLFFTEDGAVKGWDVILDGGDTQLLTALASRLEAAYGSPEEEEEVYGTVVKVYQDDPLVKTHANDRTMTLQVGERW